MMTPTVRMVAAALTDRVLGVEQTLANIGLDEQDERPKPPTILNTADHSQAVAPNTDQAIALDDWPLLVVACESPADLIVTGVVGKAFDAPNLQIIIVYITGELDQEKAWRAADYTFRATAQSLNAALFGSDKAANRVRGKVMIVKHNGIRYSPALNQLRKGRFVALMFLDLHVRVQP